MTASGERPSVALRGLGRRANVLGAVLVLQGASGASLNRATSLIPLIADRCLLIAVDGGFETCRRLGRRPDLIVGDGDSLRRPPQGVPAVGYDRDKDFSDFAGALREARRRRVKVAAIAGLLGGRLDHEWANILELGRHARGFAGLLAPTHRGTVLVTARGCRLATVRGRTASVFALNGPATVTLLGTRWELARGRLQPGSRGLSNITGTELDLTVHAGVVAVVLTPPPRRRR